MDANEQNRVDARRLEDQIQKLRDELAELERRWFEKQDTRTGDIARLQVAQQSADGRLERMEKMLDNLLFSQWPRRRPDATGDTPKAGS